MFTCQRTVLYCSAANTSNIAVFGRIAPAMWEQQQPGSAVVPVPAAGHAPNPAGRAAAEDATRTFLLERCLWPAASLLTSEAAALHQKQLSADPDEGAWQQGRLFGRTAAVQGKLAAAAAALSSCSTPGGHVAGVRSPSLLLPQPQGVATAVGCCWQT